MGGRIAEEMFMHHMTTGAGNDIERATDMARKMVCEWGMSELGPLSFGKKEEQIFLGREIAQHRDYSEETAIRIDEQVKKLVQAGYDTAHARSSRSTPTRWCAIAEALLEREMLDGAEVMQLIDGETLAPLATPKDVRKIRRHAAGDASRRRRTPPAGPFGRRTSAAGVIPRFPVYLFDIDGTLLDSRPGYLRRHPAGAWSDCLQAGTFDYLKGYIGLHLDRSVRDVFPELTRRADRRLDPANTDNVSWRAATRRRRVYPGVAEALAALGGRKVHGDHQGHADHARRARAVRTAASISITCRAPTAFPASPRRT